LTRRVRGFPNYFVNHRGEVFSEARTKLRRMKPSIDSAGYPSVELHHEGKSRRRSVHRIVLEAFIGPCPDGHEARHIDGNKRNNRLWNLAWGTPAENAADRIRHGTQLRGEDCPSAKLTADDAREILRLYRNECPHRPALAQRFGVSWATIDRIIRGVTWGHATHAIAA
jgi:hypothetical protein